MAVDNKLALPDSIVDELQQIFTEGEFASRWALIETYHRAGKLILTIKRDRTQVLHDLAPRVGRSVRTLWYAAKLAETYPDLNRLPEGKNVSMNRIITKYLTTSEQEKCTHPEDKVRIVSFKTCGECGQHLERIKNEGEDHTD